MRNKPYPYYQLQEIKNIPDLISHSAKKYGVKTAFQYRLGRKEVLSKSFIEVEDDCKKLSSYITSNWGSHNNIAIVGENSYEWILCFFAIICSGNTAVLIDKDFSSNEIDSVLRRCNCQHVFVSKTYMDIVSSEKAAIIFMQELCDKIAAVPESNLKNIIYCKDDIASICVTSGTSGSNKLVMITEENFAFEVNVQSKMFELQGNSLQLLPFHHTLGLVVSTLVVYNYGYSNFINKSLKTLKNDLEYVKPQSLAVVPLFVETFHKQIMDTVRKQNKEKQLLKAMNISNFLLNVLHIDLRKKLFKEVRAAFGGELEYIICGGAALRPELIKDFRSWGVEILQGYGATECAPVIAMNRNNYHRDGSVGNLLPGTKIKIADDGEILVKGPHVMMGYLDNKEQTDAVLKDGWYHTGDLGYLDKDNFLFITGRKKNLIILSNGENVSPEELELEVVSDSAVKEVLVYESEGVIVAEIFPEEDFIGNETYFSNLIASVNKSKPMYKQIIKVKLRDSEFIKNSSRKFVRNKNI